MRFTLFMLFVGYLGTVAVQEQESSNKHFWYSLETTAFLTPFGPYGPMSQLENWDTGLKDAAIDEEITPRAQGTILSLEGRTSQFDIVDFTLGPHTHQNQLPLANLFQKRTLN